MAQAGARSMTTTFDWLNTRPWPPLKRLSRRAPALVLAAGMATGCATPRLNYTPETTSFSRPPVNSTANVAVGDEMLSQGRTTTQAGMTLDRQVQVSWAYSLGPGFYPKVGDDATTTYYGFRLGEGSAQGYGILVKNGLADPPSAIHVNRDGSNVCVITVFQVQVCNAKARAEPATRTVSTEAAFQQTLIYNGRVGNKINIGYREFSGSLARPAFNNNVEYDLSTSDTIAYRGARLKVLKADNSTITFTVLSNFNTPR
jgi:hypothetical protein